MSATTFLSSTFFFPLLHSAQSTLLLIFRPTTVTVKSTAVCTRVDSENLWWLCDHRHQSLPIHYFFFSLVIFVLSLGGMTQSLPYKWCMRFFALLLPRFLSFMPKLYRMFVRGIFLTENSASRGYFWELRCGRSVRVTTKHTHDRLKFLKFTYYYVHFLLICNCMRCQRNIQNSFGRICNENEFLNSCWNFARSLFDESWKRTINKWEK